MATFSSDHDHYAKTFKVFTAACKEEEVYTTWVKDYFPEKVEAKICPSEVPPDELRVLGVGSGSGFLDCGMLSRLVVRFPRIISRVVEPNGDHLTRFKESATAQAHQLRGVSFDWRQQTLEEYESGGDSTRFHFISAVHVMYYMKDMEHSLMYLYDLLEPDGVLVVIMLSNNAGFWDFGERFKSSNSGKHALGSSDITDILQRRSIPYNVHTQSIWLDTTACMDSASTEGALLLDFLLCTVHFRQTAPAALQTQVLEYLTKDDGCFVKKEGSAYYLSDHHDVIVIQKPSQ